MLLPFGASLHFQLRWALHPCSGFRALENGLDDFHIGDSVLNRCWNIGVVEDGLGEGIALEGVLVAGFYLYLLSLIAMLIPDFAGLVGRSVEGYLDLNPACGAKNVDPLIWQQLCCAGKRRCAASEVQDSGGKAVDV